MDKLIVALGNPGSKYRETRHNLAWNLLEYLTFKDQFSWQEKFKGLYCSVNVYQQKIFFLKPLTYMNLSGESVALILNYFKINIDDILIIHDDIDLPFGTLAFKKGGGLAGHNGLKSIASRLQTQDFERLRLGIGRPSEIEVSNWVLSKFCEAERSVLDLYLKGAADALTEYLKNGLKKASTLYNKKSFVVDL